MRIKFEVILEAIEHELVGRCGADFLASSSLYCK